jgi:hypothetical protein
MKIYKIAVYGDNGPLHEKALAAACEAVERVNNGPVYRAWIESVSLDEEVRAQATGEAPTS